MRKYYDWNDEKVITIEDVKENYEKFADKEEYETFEKYLICCQDYNNGSLTELEIMISRLKSKLCKYYLYPNCDSVKEIELQIEQLKKQL